MQTGMIGGFMQNKYPAHMLLLKQTERIYQTRLKKKREPSAHYSKASKDQYVEVDYTPRKHLKKVKGGKPGFVIYQTYKSMVATTNISGIQQV